MTVPAAIGVLGAGTMGSGIAQLAAQAGARTLVHDPDAAALERGLDRARAGIAKLAGKGRFDGDPGEAAARLQPAAGIADLAPCGLVIEAAPERLELKQEMFAAVAAAVAPDAVLATNTSSLLVTAVAAGVPGPERVVGMHFFNPAPLMALLEVVAGERSSPAALAVARAVGDAMGKRVIDAADGPGFLVNRCNRPFGLEGLRLLAEGIAGVPEIDRAVRQGGGFRMGPFELMDLVGVDVGFAVARSFYEQSFGEPRWRPSPLSARLVAAGRTGRKAGEGFYAYGEGGHRSEDPEPPAAGGGEGVIVVGGDLPVAHELREAAAAAGWDVRGPDDAEGEVPWLIVDCGAGHEGPPLQGGPLALLVAAAPLHELDELGTAAGFHLLPPLDAGGLVELTRTPTTSDLAAERSERFFATLGRGALWVGDSPGLVLGRIVCQIVNESAFALMERVGSAADVDTGMVLGMNHPRGPLEWADAIGIDHVLAVLDALHAEHPDGRYRAAPLLRRMVAAGELGDAVGAGFRTE